MRLTRQAALGIAFVCGLLAAILVWLYIRQEQPTTAQRAVPEKVQVPVPTQDIPAQTDLAPEMFGSVPFDKDKVPKGVVTSPQVFQGRVSLVDLQAGRPVMVNQVAMKSKALGLGYGVPPGLRAMAVSLDVIGTVGDFIQPGNHVDVLASFETDHDVVVRTLVQDVQVLAVGEKTTSELPAEEGEEKGKTGEKTSAAASRRRGNLTPVTLALTPSQAQLVLASDIGGHLRLVLRAVGDTGITPLRPSNTLPLIGKAAASRPSTPAAEQAPPPPGPTAPPPGYGGPQAYGAPPAPAPTPTPPAKKRPSVEVIKGNERQIVTPED